MVSSKNKSSSSVDVSSGDESPAVTRRVTRSSSRARSLEPQHNTNHSNKKNKKKSSADTEEDEDEVVHQHSTPQVSSPIKSPIKSPQKSSSSVSIKSPQKSPLVTKPVHNAFEHAEPRIPLFTAISTYFAYGILILLGHIRDFLSKYVRPWFSDKKSVSSGGRAPEGYAPLVSDFEDFYTRRLYHRIQDCWNRPISSCPSSVFEVMQRVPLEYGKPLTLSGETRNMVNLGSYNYLGFGDPNSPTKGDVFDALENYGITTSSPRVSIGSTTLHRELEALVARFLGKEDAMIFGMGFGTNSTGIPALIGKGGLIISDSNNHSSIAVGARTSGATIRVFKHNDVNHLEQVIRRSIIDGQPKTHRPWKKILIMVEGIYSMEGHICPLKEIVAIKKKYKCFLYVDEAHSIGALGQNGRGVCEYAGVDTKDVDILMGTFTKSFGAVGGYVASSKEIIDYLRYSSAGSVYSASISPPAVQQCISAFKIILGEDGTDIGRKKIDQLKINANYFRSKLMEMGCHVLGDFDSPIVPMMLYHPCKIPAFSRQCYERGLAVVVVGFPASPLLLSRTRFCISAGHTKEQLDIALKQIEFVADYLSLKYNSYWI